MVWLRESCVMSEETTSRSLARLLLLWQARARSCVRRCLRVGQTFAGTNETVTTTCIKVRARFEEKGLTNAKQISDQIKLFPVGVRDESEISHPLLCSPDGDRQPRLVLAQGADETTETGDFSFFYASDNITRLLRLSNVLSKTRRIHLPSEVKCSTFSGV